MALKFLNKKGWHTGSLRNIENVWKAEQKHDAEQKKLEELRKQIQEERERHEFRLLQEQAGITPKQERLDFLYESGLAVGKSSEGFKALQAPTPPPGSGSAAAAGASGASSSNAAAPGAPGALFEDKPQSANDAWRKLHSDPLLLIRQREQEALARVRSNPIQMAMIRKTVEAEKDKGNKKDKHKKKHRRDKKSKHGRHSSKLKHSRDHSDSEEESEENERKEKRGPHEPSSKLKHSKDHSDSEEESGEDERRKEKRGPHEHPSKLRNSRAHSDSEEDSEERGHRKEKRARGEHSSKARHVRAYSDSEEDNAERQGRIHKRDRDDPSKSERDVRSKLSKRSPSRDSEYTRSKEKSRDYENRRYSGKEKARYTEHTGNNDKEKHEREGGHSSKTRQVRAYSDSEEDNAERQNRIHKRDRDNSPKFERDVSSKLSKRSPPRDSEYTRNKEKSRDYESSRYSSKEKAGDTERSGNDNMEKPEREGGYRSKYDNQSGTRPESQETKERHGYGYNRRRTAPKLTEEERAARLREMQLNAELHEEQRWKRLKKASEVDAREAIKDKASAGQRTFLDDAQKSIYGTEKGGSSTIEESVRRRTYYLQGGSAAAETNAFRR